MRTETRRRGMPSTTVRDAVHVLSPIACITIRSGRVREEQTRKATLLSRSGRCRRRGSSGGRCCIAVIHEILQLLARLEERNFFRGHFHPVTGLGIAPDARLALPGAEAAETANLDLVAHPQRT